MKLFLSNNKGKKTRVAGDNEDYCYEFRRRIPGSEDERSTAVNQLGISELWEQLLPVGKLSVDREWGNLENENLSKTLLKFLKVWT